MLMKLGFMHAPDGTEIPVHLASGSGTVLLECHEPAAFLYRTIGAKPTGLGPSTYLRGVFMHGSGALLQLFDTLGAVSEELHLGEMESRRILATIW